MRGDSPRGTPYLGGSAPGFASSSGKVCAPDGAGGLSAAGAVSAGELVALLAAAGAGAMLPVLARMARWNRLASSESVVMLPAMMSVAGAFLPYSRVLAFESMAMTLPSTDTPANSPRLRE